jgi:hypothetical protein
VMRVPSFDGLLGHSGAHYIASEAGPNQC